MKYIICNWKMAGDMDLFESILEKWTRAIPKDYKNCSLPHGYDADRVLVPFLEKGAEAKTSESFLQSNKSLVICPPSPWLALFDKILQQQGPEVTKHVFLGAQDCAFQESGSYTGQVSGKILRKTGCQWVIIGHSECRRFLGYDDKMIGEKIKKAFEADLKVILCIGEESDSKGQLGSVEKIAQGYVAGNGPMDISGSSFCQQTRGQELQVYQILKAQLDVLKNFPSLENLVIAYEPVWAIGSPDLPAPEILAQRYEMIQQILDDFSNEGLWKNSYKPDVLYGGAVGWENFSVFTKSVLMEKDKKSLDGDLCHVSSKSYNPCAPKYKGYAGVLLGRASLDPGALEKILPQFFDSFDS
jgi:triosephosphate isomerase (TIM)